MGIILLVPTGAGYDTALGFDHVAVSRRIRKFCLKCGILLTFLKTNFLLLETLAGLSAY